MKKQKLTKMLKKKIWHFNPSGFLILKNFYSMYLQSLKFSITTNNEFDKIIYNTQEIFDKKINKLIEKKGKEKFREDVLKVLDLFYDPHITNKDVFYENKTFIKNNKISNFTKFILILLYKQINKLHPNNFKFYNKKIKKWGNKNEKR